MRKSGGKTLLSCYNSDFFDFIPKNIFTILQKYISKDSKIIIWLSWWSDSMFLALLLYHFFVEKSYPLHHLVFVHCNHGIRKESLQEENFVKYFFAGTSLKIVRRDEWPVRRKNIKLTEEYLRNWRYTQFRDIAHTTWASFLVLGHHLDDRIESTFLHLLRGCGMRGFLSMQTYERHHLLPGMHILRPLLTLTKEQILEICQLFWLKYAQDISNFDQTLSLRNRLRNTILPALYSLSHKEGVNPTFCQSMQQVYDEISLQTFDVTTLAPIALSPYRKASFGYVWNVVKNNITTWLILSLLEYLGFSTNITKTNLQNLLKFFTTASSWYTYMRGLCFFVAHEKITIIAATDKFWKKYLDKKTKISTLWSVDLWKDMVEIIDKKYLWATLRYAQKGDTYKGKSRWKYCINNKIPIFWRNFVPLLVIKNTIQTFFYPW